jgi:divalent metal cation (Fe/Co/Zn/Cd) transporter
MADEYTLQTTGGVRTRAAQPHGNSRAWIKAAIVVTWLGIVIPLCYSIFALAVAVIADNLSLLAFALENIVDTLSSFFVIWRFAGCWGKDSLDDEDPAREEQASVAISVFFVVIAVIIIIACADQFATKDTPVDLPLVIVLSYIGLILGIGFAVAKLVCAHKVHSGVLAKDGWASACGAILALGTLIGVYVYRGNSNVWWIDAAIALAVAVFLLGYGLFGWCTLPWYRSSFWQRPQHVVVVNPAPNPNA